MGHTEASVQELRNTLSLDAEDATSHANLGWTLLHQGNLKKAEEHFREALRLDPELELARLGAIETLKSKVPVGKCGITSHRISIIRWPRRENFAAPLGL